MKIPENMSQIGIGFFGIVMASISHELKNRIATIKEQAGLLKDYIAMAEHGKKINTERLNRLGQGMTEQVGKADTILKNMNQVVRSVDNLFRSTDVNEILMVTIPLAKPLADLHRINLSLRAADSPVRVTTSPFFLMNLIWLCLETLILVIENSGTIELALVKKDPVGGLIRLQINAAELKTQNPTIPDNLLFLADALEAKVEWQSTDSLLLISLPARIKNSDRIKGLATMLSHQKE
jgi:hypothetical protein